MMTGRLATANSVTGMQPPATMIGAVILRPHLRLSRGRPGNGYFRSSTIQSTMTASRQQVVARSSPIRASLPMNVPPI